jgi:hypothetical protein
MRLLSGAMHLRIKRKRRETEIPRRRDRLMYASGRGAVKPD